MWGNNHWNTYIVAAYIYMYVKYIGAYIYMKTWICAIYIHICVSKLGAATIMITTLCTCDMTHLYLRHDSFVCANNSLVCATWLMYTYTRTHEQSQLQLPHSVRVTRRIHIYNTTCLYVRHYPFIHLFIRTTWLIGSHTHNATPAARTPRVAAHTPVLCIRTPCSTSHIHHFFEWIFGNIFLDFPFVAHVFVAFCWVRKLCTRARMHSYSHTDVYTHAHTHTFAHTNAHTRTHTYTRTHTPAHIHTQ